MAVEETNLTEAQSKYYLLVRRLHSLSGLVPVGVFLCVHLLANASVLLAADGAEFQKAIERIHALGPLLVPVEIFGIFIPILFHAIVGVRIWLTSMPNPQNYSYNSNIRYALQRTTGIIAFVFILYHVWQMHWFGASFGGGHFELHSETGAATGAITTARALNAGWWIAPIYGIGVIASVFHLSNGIWTSLITWGITIKPQTQRASGYACAVFGIMLCLVGLGALRGFKTFDTGATAASAQVPAAITASHEGH